MTIGYVLKHVDSGVEVEVCKDYWGDTVVQTKEYLSNKWHDEFDESLSMMLDSQKQV